MLRPSLESRTGFSLSPAMLVGQASACLRLPREDRLAWRLVTSPEAVAEVSQYGQATPLHSPALRSRVLRGFLWVAP